MPKTPIGKSGGLKKLENEGDKVEDREQNGDNEAVSSGLETTKDKNDRKEEQKKEEVEEVEEMDVKEDELKQLGEEEAKKMEVKADEMQKVNKGESIETEKEKEETGENSENEIGVGFRLASYKTGSVEVLSLSGLSNPSIVLPHISPKMMEVVRMFEKLVRVSGIPAFSSLDHTGNWRHLLVRTSEKGQVMVVAVVDPQGLDRNARNQLKEDLKQFFTTGAGAVCDISSLFVQFCPARKVRGEIDPAPELLSGEDHITETLFKLYFDISPQAFFQVNTKAAEVLYQAVGDLADLKDTTTLVDVCCGTGTIGLCLASRVKKLVGVELIPEAVRDARKNAEKNCIKNVSFYAGRAEEILNGILRGIDSKEIVAVVDPPRAGLHHKALLAIRNCLAIKRLVYVSCDANAAMKNFVQLTQPASKVYHGDPFIPVRVVPVDLFPHGKQFELVVLFERVPLDDLLNVGKEAEKREAKKSGENNVLKEIMGDIMDQC